MTTLTTTTVSTPRLSEVARHLVYPEGIVSTGWQRIQARLSDMAVEYDGWQEGAVRLILGRDDRGRYVATVGGVTMSIPRQVGKTFTIGSLLIAMCIEYPGLRVVWTSHHLRTTTNTFRSMQGMVRRNNVAPYLAHNGIRTANGEQEIRFTNDSIIMFGARERGFGVGIDAIDILVCDEAQRLSSRALADMVPTTNQSRHEHGALLFFIGTPPRPDDSGDEFLARRNKAISGNMSNGIFIEMSADADADLADTEQWAKANPSYPHRTSHEAMLRMWENINDEGDRRREGLGIWDKIDMHSRVIPLKQWEDRIVADEDVPLDPASRFALTMSPERIAVIASAVIGEDANYLDLVEIGRVDDSRKLLELLSKLCGRRTVLMIDQRDPAASFVNDLRNTYKVKVNTTGQADSVKACTGFVGAVGEGRITHCDQPPIRTALMIAQKKPVGKFGQWEWNIEDPTSEMAALRAMTNAHYGLSFSKKSGAGRSQGDRRAVVM